MEEVRKDGWPREEKRDLKTKEESSFEQYELKRNWRGRTRSVTNIEKHHLCLTAFFIFKTFRCNKVKVWLSKALTLIWLICLVWPRLRLYQLMCSVSAGSSSPSAYSRTLLNASWSAPSLVIRITSWDLVRHKENMHVNGRLVSKATFMPTIKDCCRGVRAVRLDSYGTFRFLNDQCSAKQHFHIGAYRKICMLWS